MVEETREEETGAEKDPSHLTVKGSFSGRTSFVSKVKENILVQKKSQAFFIIFVVKASFV